MSIAIAVFVKTPGLSPLKTRLAKGVGVDNAMTFYRLSLKAIEEVIQQSNAQGYWAVTEKEGLDNPLWQSFSRIHAGGDNLGQCQHRVYKTLLTKHDKVLLIGSDSPQITSTIINKAIETLETQDYVIGPTHDGGYYLFGGRTEINKEIWTSIEYSQETTRAELINALPSAPALLPMLSDVDTQDNLAEIIAQMPQHPNETQINLIEWIKSL